MHVHLQTLGCRLNQAEEARLAADFAAVGFERTRDTADADVCVVHSCAITRPAERETLRIIRALKQRQRDRRPLIVLSGCVVACHAADLLLAAGADLLIPRTDAGTLVPQVLARLRRPVAPPASPPPPPHFHTKRALLRVQDGCDFNCAYCIVPRARGAPVSRPWQEVLDEARALLGNEHRELVVTGCNLACYRDGTRGLPALVEALCRLATAGRIRLGSVEPGTVETELVDSMRRHANLCRFLHLPIQSGDDGILSRMGRRYTRTDLHETLGTLLASVPGLALGTDLISGLPGEDEEAFAQTRQLLQTFPFANLHVFPYSPRPGTRAAGMPGRPPTAVARSRAQQLRALGAASRARFAAGWVGRPVEVLIEGRDADGCVHGWSDTYLPCRFHDRQTPPGQLTTFIPARTEGDRLLGADEWFAG
ncbi:MAG: MiaB/RimO family radical SAM methylthiotransferase [Lentisphaerae bacterium]|nr:MiaB/RimO family radical SAM methylthiotransferase [Lentisphaerota bacterium]